MGDVKNGYQATPNATLEQQMMDACAPKNEREWWAFAEIGRLRAEVEVLQAEVVSREAAIAEALQIVRVYAARNPLHDYNGVMQDPHGAHAWLMRNDAARAAQGGE